MSQIYKFRVGVRPLAGQKKLEDYDITHAAFLIGTDLFEYGTDKKAMIASSLNYTGKAVNLSAGWTIPGAAVSTLLNETTIDWIFHEEGYIRRKGVGRDPQFDWNEVGEALNGTTKVTPDQLEKKIKDSKLWNNGKYDIFGHNCHDFVKFCLLAVGCPESMCKKIFPCYRRQNKKK